MEERKVLVVDDDPMVRRVIERLLAQENWSVRGAKDGPSALAEAARSKPDVVVLDACMPGIDGFEVCRRMREDWRLCLVPVLFLTGLDGVDSTVEGFAAGADAYLAKPFDSQELSARLDALFRRSRQALAASPLTGLPGTPSLLLETERRLEAGEAVALLYADVNDFKAFNDARGFAAGDEVLRALAGALSSAGAEGFLAAHIGGDDFALLCPEPAAARAAARLCAAFDAIPGALYGLSLSVGVALSSPLEAPSYARLAELASRVKAGCKARKGRGSLWDC